MTETAQRKIVLYDWGPSPFCMKVRAVLAHKGLPYEKVPALTKIREVARRGKIGKVPALEIDGEFLVDSTDICLELERRFPERPVVPSEPRERAACLLHEELADEALYFFGLYFHWHEPKGRARAKKYFSRTFLGRLAFVPYHRRIESQLRGHGLSRKAEAHVRRDLDRNLDAIEALLEGRDWLVGEGPTLADFAIGAQLKYLTLAASTKEVLAHRPNSVRFLERMPEIRP